jgi:hypothetical protein
MDDLPADDDREKAAATAKRRPKADVDKIIDGLRVDIADLQAKLSGGVLTLEDQERSKRPV